MLGEQEKLCKAVGLIEDSGYGGGGGGGGYDGWWQHRVLLHKDCERWKMSAREEGIAHK